MQSHLSKTDQAHLLQETPAKHPSCRSSHSLGLVHSLHVSYGLKASTTRRVFSGNPEKRTENTKELLCSNADNEKCHLHLREKEETCSNPSFCKGSGIHLRSQITNSHFVLLQGEKNAASRSLASPSWLCCHGIYRYRCNRVTLLSEGLDTDTTSPDEAGFI